MFITFTSGKHVREMYTPPPEPHCYIAKLRYAGVYLFVLFCSKTQIVGTRILFILIIYKSLYIAWASFCNVKYAILLL